MEMMSSTDINKHIRYLHDRLRVPYGLGALLSDARMVAVRAAPSINSQSEGTAALPGKPRQKSPAASMGGLRGCVAPILRHTIIPLGGHGNGGI